MRVATGTRCRSKLAAALAAGNGGHARPRRARCSGRRFNRDMSHAFVVAVWIKLSASNLTERMPSGGSTHLRIVHGHLPTSAANFSMGIRSRSAKISLMVVAFLSIEKNADSIGPSHNQFEKEHNRANRAVARGLARFPRAK